MKKNSHAFTLIKGLTMSEKRYFKIFSERHTIGEQNKYVVLFDELDRIKEEDEAEIKKNLRRAGINTDFLSADKNYLYQLVLRSLNVFHDSKTINLEVKEILSSVEILFYKGLYKECLKLISRAETMAEECENFALMIDILMWKKKCAGYSLGLKEAAAINESIDKYIDLLTNLKRITDLYYESNLLQSSTEKLTKQESLKKFREILEEPELRSKNNARSFYARIFYHLIYANYYYAIDNKQKEYEHLQELVDMLNASQTYAVENPLDYISVCNRLLGIKKYFAPAVFFDDILNLNEFAKRVAIKNEAVTERIFVHTNTHEIEYYLINNEYDKALKKISGIERQLSKMNFTIEPYHLMYFYYLHAITLICVGEFRRALKFINDVLNNFDSASRPQVFVRIELLAAAVHFELKNYDLVKSISKQLLKKNAHERILIQPEEMLLASLLKIVALKHINPTEETEIFRELETNFKKSPYFRRRATNSLVDNYYKWIVSKIKRKFISEV
ncbi:MAG: hypothetical protein ACXVC6_00435 [Bacteroidia bacterium]